MKPTSFYPQMVIPSFGRACCQAKAATPEPDQPQILQLQASQNPFVTTLLARFAKPPEHDLCLGDFEHHAVRSETLGFHPNVMPLLYVAPFVYQGQRPTSDNTETKPINEFSRQEFATLWRGNRENAVTYAKPFVDTLNGLLQ